MDRILTLFGYLSSYFVPSRRNGPTNGDSNVGVKRSHNINENFTDSGLNSTSVGLHDVATGDKKLRRPRASAFTEPGLQGTLRGEDFDIKYPNDSTTKSSNFIGRNGKSGLPPVWDNPASNRKENMNGIKVLLDSEEASEGKSTRRPKTDTILPRVHHDLRKELLISEAQKGKQLPKTIKEPGKSKGLPNVFSNLGKSFVETNQLAVFNRSSFRKNPASLVKDSDTYKHPSTVNDESGYENGRQSQTETPKDRKKKKTTTKKKDVHKGSGKSPNERRESAYVGQNVKEDRANVCVEKPSGPSKKESIKTGEHRATEDSDGMREKPSKQRPGTALERWFKKHKGTVAPAQLDGLNNGATGHLKETEGEFKTKIENLFDGKAPEAYDSCVLTTPHVKRVFVSECQENVSVLLVKDDSLGKNTEMETVQDEVSKRNDVSLRVPQKDLAEKAIKIEISGDEATRKDVEKDKSPQKIEKAEQETCQAKSDQENNHRRQKATPSCSSNMQESNGLLKEEIGHIDKEREDPTEAKPFTLPYPVKRDLLKETVDNICLASLNDGATNQPKITIKKELDTKRLDRNDFYREKKRNISVSDVGDLASVFESGGELKSLLQHSKTVSVQQRLEKTSKDISLKDKTPRQCNQLGHVLRQLPIVYDSPDSETFEIKDNVVSREPMKATRSPRNLRFPRLNGGGVLGNQVNSATGHPLVPPLGRNKTTKKELNPALKMVTVNAERDAVLQKTIEKPKWDTGKPCLPSIESQRTQMVEDILEKRRRKQEKEMADDFEGWGNYDDEPEEIKRILERPLTAKSPTYPAHWRPVPTQRPLGREGQRCRLGVISKKPEKRFLPESASEDLTNIQLEEPEELYHASHREKTPPKRLPLFDTDTYKRYVNKHEEPTTWCKTLRVRQRSAYSHFQERYLADDNVDIEDVEEFF